MQVNLGKGGTYKNSKGSVYADGQSLENVYLGKAVQEGKAAKNGETSQKGEAPERTLELVAQWEKTTILTRKAKEGTHLTLSRTQEEVDQNGEPLGSDVTTRVPKEKEVMWAATQGGTDAYFWSCKGRTLEKDTIKRLL